ncbi:DUF892 family protein [Deinococcus ruber]|uniref:DUF892 family protein n=1 Tax=Deinococcus ruber TaxID=1848197 RepID=UPI0016672556|nr:DUF892 family protein [Deinococcus ruber]
MNLRPSELRALYVIHLQQLYSTEVQALDALPTVAIDLSAPAVRQRLLLNAIETPVHMTMLETIFAELGEEPDGPSCEAMGALVRLCGYVREQRPAGLARDVLLVGVVQEMKHLGIAKYTMAQTFAKVLGYEGHLAWFSRAKGDEERAEQELNFFVLGLELTDHGP